MSEAMKKITISITDEDKKKFINLCSEQKLSQREMLQQLIDFYRDNQSSIDAPSQFISSTNDSSYIVNFDLDEEEKKEVEKAKINSGQELKIIAKDGLMYRAKYLNTSQTNLVNIPLEELRSSTARGVAAYKIEKCVSAIIEHNNASPEKKDKVCLSKTLVQKLTGSNPTTINKWFEEHRITIDDHNSKHELTHSNNRRGAGFDYFQLLNLEYLKA